MSLSSMLKRAHAHLLEQQATRVEVTDKSACCVLFFSLSDGCQRAYGVQGRGANLEAAWQHGARRVQNQVRRRKLKLCWLRIDWPTHQEQTTWGELQKRLSVTRRNYFRYGLALDEQLQHAFLEGEINANAMLYPGSDQASAGINSKNFLLYAKHCLGQNLDLDFAAPGIDEAPVWIFAHEGIFVSTEDTSVHFLPGPGSTSLDWRESSVLTSGHRHIHPLGSTDLRACIESSARFLATQVKRNGQFIYGHFPNFGRLIPTYNTLRHTSTIYSMLEAWELMRDPTLFKAICRALQYLDTQIIRRYPQADGTTLAFNVDINDEIKLGASAVSILALVKYDELTGDTRYRPLMEELALGICFMQCGEVDAQGQPTGAHPGKFVHVVHAADLRIKAPFRIVYYDGEAAFGLMRLYGLTRDKRWLHSVERAFEYFIVADHWKHHDHWLSYCANELTLYKPEEKYFRFGVQNIAGYLDFIQTRETTFPTLLELSMAFEAMLQRIKSQHPEMRHLVTSLDIDAFYRALHHRAHYLLNGFFWPEQAMYYAAPRSIVGSFYIRHHAFRVRIDDVEHYLSGYVAYWKMLQRDSAVVSAHEEYRDHLAQPTAQAEQTQATAQTLPRSAQSAAVQTACISQEKRIIHTIKMPHALQKHDNGILPESLLLKIRGGYLFNTAAVQWNKMRLAAAADGINILPQQGAINTYRSLKEQERIFFSRYQASSSETKNSIFYKDTFYTIKTNTVYAQTPGLSTHGWGLAVDIELDKRDRVLNWLKINAVKFGFCWEYDFEPWHLVYFCGDDLPPTWTTHCIEQAVQGRWLIEPDNNFSAGGITAWSGCHSSDNMILLAANTQEKGVRPEDLKRMIKKKQPYAGLITSMSSDELAAHNLKIEKPVYQVKTYANALFELAEYARRQFAGVNVGITGSAGKTSTTHMMSGVFSSLLSTASTRENANLPFGVAWNLCQIPWSTKLNVIELAIGKMIVNTNLARPDIAVITNIAPAHLVYHKNINTVALRKSKIFMGVKDDGWAVICRDTDCFYLIKRQAELQRLNIITYGQHHDSDIKLIAYDDDTQKVAVKDGDYQFSYFLAVPGRHMAINSLACLAVAKIMGIEFDQLRPGFAATTAAEGRGVVADVNFQGKQIRIYDESYNANPLSMRVTLAMFASIKKDEGARKILVLGDMLELGDNALKYHEELVDDIAAVQADMVFLVGNLLPQIAPLLTKRNSPYLIFSDADALWLKVKDSLQNGDHILFKASNGIGLKSIITQLQA